MSDHDLTTPEVWKPIPFLPIYEASTHGRIKSHKRGKTRLLRPTRRANGYYFTTLYGNGAGKNGIVKMVHRIILETFVGECPPGMECRHLDGNPSNNRLENLAWGTKQENQADRHRHGTDSSGTRNALAVLTDDDVRQIRRLWVEGMTQKDIGEKYGVTQENVSEICNGRTWKHIGGKIERIGGRSMGSGVRKMTPNQVLEIRRLKAEGMSQTLIAKRFGLVQPTVSAICNRKTWTEI